MSRLKHLQIVPAAVLSLYSPLLFPAEQSCYNLPPPNPDKSFLENFLSPCFEIRPLEQTGSAHFAGDLNSTYGTAYYRVNPQFELILVGEYAQARYMSVVPYDDHLAIVTSLQDSEIVPLPGYQNPYLAAAQFREDQLYAVTIRFGGAEPSPESVVPGCSVDSLNLAANVFDATRRHPGITWNGVSGLPDGTLPHNDGPSSGGQIEIRAIFKQPDGGTVQLANPAILVRDLTTGCAVPAYKAIQRAYTTDDPNRVVTLSWQVATRWIDQDQIRTHQWYATSFQPRLCYAPDPLNGVLWFGPKEYVRSPNPDTGYLLSEIPQGAVDRNNFMRMRFKLPVLPNTPCAGCSLTGSEELRYWSLSFTSGVNTTLATLADNDIVTDADGNATIIVGFGAVPPGWVNPSNYYTYLDLSWLRGQTPAMIVRTILPAAGFQCAAQRVPPKTMEYNPVGGYMGSYVPVVDFIPGSAIPERATPLPPMNSCGLTPPYPPQACQ